MKSTYTLFIALYLFGSSALGQTQAAAPSVHDVFLNFLTEKMNLTVEEKKQMRPLVIGYLGDTRKVAKTTKDPLLREQARIELKLRYRREFAPIIGDQRATRFFTEEQLFRRKIREELKSRNVKENKN